jgi:hypothetical protein
LKTNIKYRRKVSWKVKRYGKYGGKGKLNSEKILKILKKSKVNSEKIWKIQKKIVKR